MDSTGSSLMSTTSSMQIEDIIADMGDPYDDYSGSCLAAHNCSQMFCTQPYPSQQAMYDQFLKSKDMQVEVIQDIKEEKRKAKVSQEV